MEKKNVMEKNFVMFNLSRKIRKETKIKINKRLVYFQII